MTSHFLDMSRMNDFLAEMYSIQVRRRLKKVIEKNKVTNFMKNMLELDPLPHCTL
jgi:hypothetical protein